MSEGRQSPLRRPPYSFPCPSLPLPSVHFPSLFAFLPSLLQSGLPNAARGSGALRAPPATCGAEPLPLKHFWYILSPEIVSGSFWRIPPASWKCPLWEFLYALNVVHWPWRSWTSNSLLSCEHEYSTAISLYADVKHRWLLYTCATIWWTLAYKPKPLRSTCHKILKNDMRE